MELREEKAGWSLILHEGRLGYIHIDFRLGLDIVDVSGTANLMIETPFRLSSFDAEVLLTPADSASLGPVLPLFNTEVVGLAIRKTGQLKVEFGNGCSLEVYPDESYEAWQFGSSLGFMLVCSPGGIVSLFREGNPPAAIGRKC
jgi:hypothetical protein